MVSQKSNYIDAEKRDRLLNFRVSQSEVRMLVRQAKASNARSLSEYVRHMVLGSLEKESSPLEGRDKLVEEALLDLARIQDVLKGAEESIRKVVG